MEYSPGCIDTVTTLVLENWVRTYGKMTHETMRSMGTKSGMLINAYEFLRLVR